MPGRNLPPGEDDTVIFSIPSGNFGNMMGGLLAKRMGLPVKRFVIATNENDEVPVYWKTGNYHTVVPSRNCVSSAMNVGHPSNMARVVSLYGGIMDENGNIIREPDIQKMRSGHICCTASATRKHIERVKAVYSKFGYLLEPHGAAGWAGLMQYFRHYPADDDPRISLPLVLKQPILQNFPRKLRNVLDIDPVLPAILEGLDKLEESFDKLENDYSHFKELPGQRSY